MRRITERLLFVVPFAGLLSLFACESESGTAGPQLNVPDGGGFDSTTPPFDAGTPETSTSGPVTLTVIGENGPLSEQLVVFHDAAGAVIETKRTDASGKTSSTGATPAMVSLLTSRETERNIITWTGVEGGDELTYTTIDRFAPRGTYDVSLTAPFAGAVRYTAHVGNCDLSGAPWTGATPASLALNAGCARAQNAVLVTAIDGNGNTLAHAFAKDVALPASGGSQAVTVGAFVAATDVAATFSNGPASAVSLFLTEIVNGVGYPNYTEDVVEETSTHKTATGFADAIQAGALAFPMPYSELFMFRRVAAPVAPGSFAFDFATALPSLTSATVDEANPKRPTVTWTSAQPLTASDGGLVLLSAYLGGDTQLAWTFVVAPGATTVTAPAMPAEADAWLPGAAAEPYRFPELYFFESDLVPNYSGFRRQQGKLLDDPTFDGLPALPNNGTLKISVWLDDQG
jgi:hypothetical protein